MTDNTQTMSSNEFEQYLNETTELITLAGGGQYEQGYALRRIDKDAFRELFLNHLNANDIEEAFDRD